MQIHHLQRNLLLLDVIEHKTELKKKKFQAPKYLCLIDSFSKMFTRVFVQNIFVYSLTCIDKSSSAI